jgi:hypothetical protein
MITSNKLIIFSLHVLFIMEKETVRHQMRQQKAIFHHGWSPHVPLKVRGGSQAPVRIVQLFLKKKLLKY